MWKSKKSSVLVVACAVAMVGCAIEDDLDSESIEQTQQAVTIKGPATPVNVFYAADGISIGVERIAVRKTLVQKAASSSLDLTLDELKTDGTSSPLAQQTVSMVDVTLVTMDGPKKRALVDVDWTTGPLAPGSAVLACVQALALKKNGTTRALDGGDCEVLTPGF